MKVAGKRVRTPEDERVDAENLALFKTYHQSGSVKARNELVVRHMEVAAALARRFSGRGEPLEDLEQVARFALVRAVERFDPDRGVPFVGFAVPTILGELKRHFRDRTWSGSVRRSIKELLPRIRSAEEFLEGELGRSVTPTEIAIHLGITVDDVLEALEAGQWYRARSLSRPGPDGGEGLSATLADPSRPVEESVDRVFVSRLLDRLDERDRKIVVGKFLDGKSQDQIAHELGISQMHVSRLLRRAVERLSSMAGETR